MIRKECSTTPILVFSSSIEKDLPQKLARAGADLFIRKDQNFRVLQDVIPGLVERARMQREFLDTAKAELTKWSGIVKAEYQKQRIYLEDISAQLDSLGAEGDAQGYGRELSRTA
jgi:DNA-binding NarL/FixJ family response regulator